jgi:hypothetical protein
MDLDFSARGSKAYIQKLITTCAFDSAPNTYDNAYCRCTKLLICVYVSKLLIYVYVYVDIVNFKNAPECVLCCVEDLGSATCVWYLGMRLFRPLGHVRTRLKWQRIAFTFST